MGLPRDVRTWLHRDDRHDTVTLVMLHEMPLLPT